VKNPNHPGGDNDSISCSRPLLVKTVTDRPTGENINYGGRVNLDGLLGRV